MFRRTPNLQAVLRRLTACLLPQSQGGEQVFPAHGLSLFPSRMPWGPLEPFIFSSVINPRTYLALFLTLLGIFSSYLSPTSFTGPKTVYEYCSNFFSIQPVSVWFPGKLFPRSLAVSHPRPFCTQQCHFHGLSLPCAWDCLC